MEFRILGPLEAWDGERSLSLGGTKQRALLALLLLNANRVVSSDRLIAELWGETDGGGKALQVAVSRLRRALEPGLSSPQESRLLVTRPPGYELRLQPGQLDLQRFEEGVARGREALEAGEPGAAAGRLREALLLWRGAPLGDLAYEQFSQAEIARLEDLRLSALEDRVAADLELGRHSALVGELERLVTEHPYRERLWGALMLALYRSGRQAEALSVYRQARGVLVDQLGIEPGRELKELERRILAQDTALDAMSPAEEAAAAAPSHGFVARERELRELTSALEGALTGSGGLALVGGEPGIGKSRLAEELSLRARRGGGRVLVGRCWEAGGAPPYWPWVQALRSYMRELDPDVLRDLVGRGATDLGTIVPELHELLPDLEEAPATTGEGARFRLFESVAGFMRSAAAREPLVVLLDDLHAADEPSLLLLRFVAGELRDAPILIVGCYRDTEVGPDHPLAEALPDFARERAFTRIALRGLDQADTERLLEVTTGEAAPPGLAARVYAETEGNPLFAGQIGQLIATEGPLDPLPMPEGVRETIGRRLKRQSPACRQVLTRASVLGREFDVGSLEEVLDLSQDELFDALEEAAAASLVGEIPAGGGRMRFSHVLVRDALYEDIPATRRPVLHHEAGEALEALHAGSLAPHLAEIAHHYLQAGRGGTEKAIRYATAAGDRAASQLAFEEAARHYGSALALVESTAPGDGERTCPLLLSLGEVLSRAGDTKGARLAFRRAADVAEAEGRPEDLATAALGYGGRFVWGRAGMAPLLVPLLERALSAVGEQDSVARVRLLARLASALRDDPLRDRRVKLAHEAVEMARRVDDPFTLAYALDGAWTAVEGPDHFQGIETADELISLGQRIGDKERVYVGHDYRLHTFWAFGDRAGVDVELDRLRELADELRQPAQQWHLGVSQAVLALMEGRFDEAEALIARTVAEGRRAQSWNADVSQRLALFVLRREQGRLAELEDVIERSVHEYPALQRFQCVLAHLYAELGRGRSAREALDKLLERDLARVYVDAEWLFGMNLLPDVCAYLGDAEAAAQLYPVLLPYERLYAEAPVEALSGSVARGLGVLATTCGRFDEAEGHFEAAIETERRMGALPWQAHARHDLAAMLLARGSAGDRERARELAAEAVRTYGELGMESWAARARALA